MRRSIASIVLLACMATAASARAEVSDWGAGWQVAYQSAFNQAHEAGLEPGRNLLDCHWLAGSCVERGRVESSTARLEGWLHPPEPEPMAVTESGYASSSGVTSSTVQCESGGDYGAVSADGQYWGGWQYDYQSWIADGGDPASYGSASAAEQDAVAANAPFDRWPNC